MTLGLSQTLRAAQAEIARHAKAKRAPLAIYQDAGESATAFRDRAAQLREHLPKTRMLIAVCAPFPERVDGVTYCELTVPMLEALRPGPESFRYYVFWSGRGAAKSWGIARVLLVWAVTAIKPLLIFCGRELQASLPESSHRLLSEQIGMLDLGASLTVQQSSIACVNGSEFIFGGVKNNPAKFKSTEGIDICWLEEAQSISRASWEVIVPTIRKPGSRIVVSFNADQDDDPTYTRFVTEPPPNSRIVFMSWRDNPYLSAEAHAEREYLARVDADAYANVWEGACRTVSDAQIFKGKYVIEEFTPNWGFDGPYQGLDLGYVDPTVLVRCWIFAGVLFVEHEAWRVRCDIDQTPALLDEVPDSKRYVIRCDSANPGMIEYLRDNGFPRIEAVQKWPDSITDGVARMRAFEKIIVHPRCVRTADEFRRYSYKTDKLSGDVLPDIVDRDNHCIDSIRYAIQPIIRNAGEFAFASLGSPTRRY